MSLPLAIVVVLTLCLVVVLGGALVELGPNERWYRRRYEDERPSIERAARRTRLLPAFDYPHLARQYLADRRNGKRPSYRQVVTRDRRSPNHPGLVEWEDKYRFYRMLDRIRAPHPRVFFYGVPQSADALGKAIADLDSFVLKPTHLATSQDVYCYSEARGLTSLPKKAIAARGFAALRRRPDSFENDALRLVRPAILVEELIPLTCEIKFVVVWGRVVVGKVLFGGLRPFGEVTRHGTYTPMTRAQPYFAPPPYLSGMVAVAEQVCRGTDLMRLDFLCHAGGFVVGEATPHSASRLTPGAEKLVARLLVDGYAARAAVVP